MERPSSTSSVGSATSPSTTARLPRGCQVQALGQGLGGWRWFGAVCLAQPGESEDQDSGQVHGPHKVCPPRQSAQ